MTPITIHPAGLPLADSLREAVGFLRRPFLADLVLWRPVDADQVPVGELAQVAPYVNRALVIDRLNLVCGHLWADEYAITPAADADSQMTAWCKLTVDDVTRCEQGQGPSKKAVLSDALKRAAGKFGVGTYLNAAPRIEFTVGDSDRYRLKRVGERTFLTELGRSKAAEAHALWLQRIGDGAYGPPLEHGAPDQRTSAVLQGESRAEVAELGNEAAARAERLAASDARLRRESLLKAVEDLSDDLKIERPVIAESIRDEDLDRMVRSLEAAKAAA